MGRARFSERMIQEKAVHCRVLCEGYNRDLCFEEISFPPKMDRWVDGDWMKRSSWIGIVSLFALAGCLSRVDREAISFPDMPNMPVYHRADGQQLSQDQTIDALQAAEDACRTQVSGGGAASSAAIGSPSFDSCMQDQGYSRVR